MLANVSIRAKIIMVISFLLVAIVGMGLFSIREMQGINANAVELQTGWMPRARAIGDLQMGMMRYRILVRDHMLVADADKRNALEKKATTQESDNERFTKAYEAMIASAEERKLYEEFRKSWMTYVSISKDVLTLSRNQEQAKAVDMFLNKATPFGYGSDEILAKGLALSDKGADAAGAAANDSYAFAFKVVVGVLSLLALLGIGVSFYLVRDVSGGIASIVIPMQALGKGDLTAMVPHQGEKTEIGAMADTLQVFKEALIAKKAADEAAAADAEAKIERGRRVDAITRNFETMIGEIVQTVSSASTQLESSAGTLSATADRSEKLTTAVAAASEEASTNVQSVASATEELSSSVNEISRQVQESARMATDAVGQARVTNDRVSQLSKAASRIGEVVELINTIAGQTNLLALNATIEAARAGEAGRGFAVVASEVKALAEQTAKATGEIGQQISGIQAATEESVNAIKEISGTIERLSEISSTIAAAVEEQGAATQEISRNVQQAAQGTQQVSANISDVQRGASETGTASSQVLSAAQSLSGDSNRLKLEVGKFLESVRAA
jgi:methyl-accepting chemotaxis protein